MLDENIIEGFVASLLLGKFDGATTIPKVHKEWWKLCTSEDKLIAIAAPRGHAKSTAITLSFLLASVLFKQSKFVILVSDTETQASLFLGDITSELSENEDLKSLFGLKKFLKLSATDIIVEMEDGSRFRIIAKGAEQKLRGLKWGNKRPDLIICHKEDTDIYTPETGWIKNQDYPNAKIVSSEVYEVEFEDGIKEIVSSDHRYFIEGYGWKFPWQMKSNENVIENLTDDIMNSILSAEKNKTKHTTQIQKLKNGFKSGLQIILMLIIIQGRNGRKIIPQRLKQILRNTVGNILAGWLLNVQNVGQRS